MNLTNGPVQRLGSADTIAIVGAVAGGKTTLAHHLAGVLNHPVHHVDSVCWQPGWRMTPAAERERVLNDIAATKRWIIDGNGAEDILARRFEAADAIIFLDYARMLHWARLLRRQLGVARHPRRELPDNCPESSLSHTWWLTTLIWRFHRIRRPWMLQQLAAQAPAKVIIHVTNTDECEAILDFQSDGPCSPPKPTMNPAVPANTRN
jgi:adenylate kinase family enzyme